MKQCILLAMASLAALLAGCGTDKIADYQPSSPPATERNAQAAGVEIAIDPFVERARTQQYFDIDAVAEGIAILHVRVANKTTGQTFLLEKKDIQLVPEGAGAGLAADKKIERAPEWGVGPATPTSVLIGGPGGTRGLMYAAKNSKFTEIQRNFTDKEMADATLSPGKSAEGFIYFMPVKEGVDWSRSATVKVNLTETKSQQTIALTIPLSH